VSDTEQVFRLPDLGEGLTEGEILRWLVKVGQVVAVNEPIVEVETAKAAVELPSPYAGTISEQHAVVGETLPVGSPLVTFADVASPAVPSEAAAPEAGSAAAGEAAGEAASEAGELEDGASGPVLVGYGVTAAATRRRTRKAPSPHGTERPEAGPPGEPVKPVRHGGLEIGRAAEARFGDGPTSEGKPVLAKPPVRKLARELGVDLQQVTPTGADGVVTREDVKAAAALQAPLDARPALSIVPDSAGLHDSREEVRGVTRLMAEAMTTSAFTIPHVTEWIEIDVTRSVELLERMRTSPSFAEVKISPLLLVARACVASLQRHPRLNAAFDAENQEIVSHGDVNLGIAAATPRGLVVPNIRAAQQLQLPELAVALQELVTTAKLGKTSPEQMMRGTFTITNVGVYGIDGGTPIINPGESAILAVGAWREKPWVHGGQVVPRTVTTLSLSFDHRFIDGATGSQFLRDVADVLSEPAATLAW